MALLAAEQPRLPGRSFSTRQRDRHSRGSENNPENDVIRAVGQKSEEEKDFLSATSDFLKKARKKLCPGIEGGRAE